MRRVSSAPHATGLAAILLMSTAGAQAHAQAQFKHDGTGRIIAMSNLSPATDCFPEIATGAISERHIENGRLRGLTFRDNRSDEIHLNVTEPSEFRAEATKAKVAEGYEALLAPGHTLRIGFKVCGAAGRIKKLDAISLVGARVAPAVPAARSSGDGILSQAPAVDDPDQVLLRSPGSARDPGTVVQAERSNGSVRAASAAPSVPTRTAWRASAPTKVQFDMAIASTDRAAGWSISCMRDVKGQVHFSNWLVGSKNWRPNAQSSRIAIDGVVVKWEIDGADEGVTLSDSMQNNTTTLSPQARGQIARGERLVVNGYGARNRPRDAVFDISGGEAAFASFEARCQTLPRG